MPYRFLPEPRYKHYIFTVWRIYSAPVTTVFFSKNLSWQRVCFFFRDVKGRRSGPSRVVLYLNVFGLISLGLLSRSSRAWTRSVFFGPFCRSIDLFCVWTGCAWENVAKGRFLPASSSQTTIKKDTNSWCCTWPTSGFLVFLFFPQSFPLSWEHSAVKPQ